MKSLNLEYLQTQPITQNILQTIRRIAEYKGKQDLYKKQSPQLLETLRQAAIIQSTESSNRLEGITARTAPTSPLPPALCCSFIETFISFSPLREANGNRQTMRLPKSGQIAQRLSVFLRFRHIRPRTPWKRFTGNSMSSGRPERSNRFF